MNLSSIAAGFGFIGVALGAFGAHGLEGKLSTDAAGWWETATLYLLVHAGVAAAISFRRDRADGPAGLFLLGCAVFSGSLYAMALGAPTWLGALTPLGGLSLLGGWAWLAVLSGRRQA